MMRDGRLTCYRRGSYGTQAPLLGEVYVDGDIYAFDPAAFDAVCREAGCSPAVVKRELKESGSLRGKQINNASYETRMTAYNAYGERKTIRVYAVDRSSIDMPGEPSAVNM